MTTPLTEAREAEIRADCEKAFVHQMDSERTVREDRELLLTALDSERAKVAELVKALGQYGDHRFGCERLPDGAECSCGFSDFPAALSRARQA